MAFASLGNMRVTAGYFFIPLYGIWAGDLTLAGADAVPTDTQLVVGNLSLKAHVYRTAQFAGSQTVRVVGGYGGWRTVLPSKPYALPSGILLSMVLGDAAREAGEQVRVASDRNIGSAYVRPNARGSVTLRHLAGANWYVDPAGVTQIQAWPTKRIVTAFTVENLHGASGRVSVATEDYAAWMPNATFTSPVLVSTYRNCGVMYKLEGDGQVRLEVMTR